MNYNKTFVFVAKAGQSLKTSGLSSTLADGQLGILNKSMTCVAAAPTYSASNYIHIALGNNDSSLSSFKSPAINPKKVTKYFGYAASSASTTGQVQISYVGFDEVDDTGLSAGVYQPIEWYTPATEAEYLEYLKSKEK